MVQRLRTEHPLDALGRDVRYAYRRVRRDHAASAVIVLTLALTVGASTTLLSLVAGILERPLPVYAPGELAAVSLINPRNGAPLSIYLPMFERMRVSQTAFQSISLYVGGGIYRAHIRNVDVDGGIETATPGYFEQLGVHPALGRFPTAAENSVEGHATPYVVVSYRFWQRYLASDPHAIGERVTLEGIPLFVVGVMQREFQGLYIDGGTDFWTSMDYVRATAGDPSKPLRARAIIGRLKPGVTIAQAGAGLSAVWPSVVRTTLPTGLAASERDDLQRARIDVQPASRGFSRLRQTYGDPLQALTILTILLFLVGCTNVSGVLLARLLAREREMATQLALGASHAAILRQTAIETVLLATAGGLCAWWVAFKGSAALGAFLWNGSVDTLALSLTPSVPLLLFALAVVAGCGLIVGIVPAWLVMRGMDGLSRTSVQRAGRRDTRAGRWLVAGQVALSLVLLACASLFVRTLQNLRANDSAFPASHIVLSRMWVKPEVPLRTKLDGTYYQGLADRLTAIPGVSAASFSTTFPSSLQIQLPQEPIRRTDALNGSTPIGGGVDYLAPRFFETIGIERIAGRDFTWHDDAGSTPVAIVNTVLAHRLFPNGDAIGQHITIGRDQAGPAYEIVGIVADAPVFGIRVLHIPVAFRPLMQNPRATSVPMALVRATGNVDPVVAGYTSVIASSPFHFLRKVDTLEAFVDQSLQQERLAAWGATLFAALALLLAGVGIYGLVASTTARRTQEIGVRMALGAGTRSIVGMVIRQGFAPAAAGVLIGMCGALAAGRWAQSLLYGVMPYDPVSIGAAATLLFAIALAAGAIPAYRASTLQPVRALRQD